MNITGYADEALPAIAEVKDALNGLTGKTVNLNMTPERCTELLGVSLDEVHRLRSSGELDQRVRDALSGRSSVPPTSRRMPFEDSMRQIDTRHGPAIDRLGKE